MRGSTDYLAEPVPLVDKQDTDRIGTAGFRMLQRPHQPVAAVEQELKKVGAELRIVVGDAELLYREDQKCVPLIELSLERLHLSRRNRPRRGRPRRIRRRRSRYCRSREHGHRELDFRPDTVVEHVDLRQHAQGRERCLDPIRDVRRAGDAGQIPQLGGDRIEIELEGFDPRMKYCLIRSNPLPAISVF